MRNVERGSAERDSSGTTEDGAVRRKPWHAPKFMVSNARDAEHSLNGGTDTTASHS